MIEPCIMVDPYTAPAIASERRRTGILASDPRLDNFDLLRLMSAVSVVFLHAYALSLNPALKILAKFANLSLVERSLNTSSLAVKVFFVISGYLIFNSYDCSRSIKEFALKRFLRIYPAYGAVIVITALACSLLTSLSVRSYFLGPFWKYLFANLVFCNMLYPRLPGVFVHNPGLTIVNGALWTIKVEVMFYCSVPVLHYFLRRFAMIPMAMGIYLFSIVYKEVFTLTHHLQLANQLPGQLSFFISGAVLYYKKEALLEHARWLLVPCSILFVIEHTVGIEVFQPFALSVLVIWFAFRVPALFRFRPRWDISYGIYIIHFPVMQWLVSKGLFVVSPYFSILVGAIVVTILASLSWLLVEKPMQRRKATW